MRPSLRGEGVVRGHVTGEVKPLGGYPRGAVAQLAEAEQTRVALAAGIAPPAFVAKPLPAQCIRGSE